MNTIVLSPLRERPEDIPLLVDAVFHNPQSDLAKVFLSLPQDQAAANEGMIQRLKGFATAARFLWPVPDRGLNERLYRVKRQHCYSGEKGIRSCRRVTRGRFKNS